MDINLLAVLVASIISIVIGFIWYMPAVFGKIWMKEIGKNREDLMSGAGKAYSVMTISTLITAYILAIFISYANAETITEGAIIGLLAWVGFVGTVHLNNVAFEKRSWKLYLINSGFELIAFLLMGAIIASFR